MIELDVRDLPAPEPMQAALTELKFLDYGDIIHFHHVRVPKLLLPRLANHYFALSEVDDVHLYICCKEDTESIKKITKMISRREKK